MEKQTKKVRFDIYCERCEHHDLNEKMDPCNECLEVAAREGTRVPEYYKPAANQK